ncbi:acyltransferase family protein [Bacillus sp. NEB1478]|uniref:acyltransferase family protein n=1 Tax=Bacillus sp. NEB1478 TaxID=3073816 RepID=UPI002873422F|nr:acyltransferase family protein [Bacillus sp. NEB1478]WNB92740.1 acyltransferase family protein [Bacillus sp. NEB1478]
MIKEWNLLRTIACLTIVFLHSTSNIGLVTGFPKTEYYQLMRIILCYATPTFVVLSEIILANRYPEKLPDHFWSKRIKWIFAPYLSFAVIDALVSFHLNPNVDISQKIVKNIFLGSFEGYFVLIIFQFYVLHYFVTKYRLKMEWLIPISILSMIFHFQILEGDIAFVKENMGIFKIPFTAWFCYFTVAYVIGRNYSKISAALLKYKWLTAAGVLVSLAIVFVFYKAGYTGIGSRRIDLLPVSLSISVAVIAWGQLIKKSKIINTISNYSFGIYLIHWQVQRYLGTYAAQIFENTFTRVMALFVLSLIISMAIIKLISMLPFGAYIVGNIKRKIPKSQRKNLMNAA